MGIGKRVSNGNEETRGAEAAGESPLVFVQDKFVFNRTSGMFYSVSVEAACILKSLWKGKSIEETEDVLAQTFGIERHTAVRDMSLFVTRLGELDLLPAWVLE